MTPAATPEALVEALAEFQRRNGYHKPEIEDLLMEFGELVLADLQRVTAERDEAQEIAKQFHGSALEAEEATAEAASLRAEADAKDRARDDALKAAIRVWSAKLHIPVTRMMSRELRAEFSAALARAATAGEGRSDG